MSHQRPYRLPHNSVRASLLAICGQPSIFSQEKERILVGTLGLTTDRHARRDSEDASCVAGCRRGYACQLSMTSGDGYSHSSPNSYMIGPDWGINGRASSGAYPIHLLRRHGRPITWSHSFHRRMECSGHPHSFHTSRRSPLNVCERDGSRPRQF